MQTSQVTNPANLFSTPTTNKQADNGNAAASFGQVLSREVSMREKAPEPVKNKDASASHFRQQPTGTGHPGNTPKPAKSAEAKPSGDGKSAPSSETKSADASGAADEAEESASHVSDELLALVANLNQMSIAATQMSDTANTATSDVGTTDAGQMLAAAGLIRLDTATSADPQAQGSDASSDAGALSAAGDDWKTRLDTMDLEAQGRALKNALTESGGDHDFASQIKDSLAAAGANSTAGMQPAQAAAMMHLQSQNALAAQAAAKLTPAVGTSGWDQALGQKVVWMVAGEQQSASLTLNPPDLGPLQVVLSVSNSQANATFTAAQPEVRQALEAAMPKLREMLGEAGIQLGQATVNSGSANQHGAQDQQASHARRGTDNGNSSNGRSDEPTSIGRVTPTSSGQGMVDTFA
jgi:flagellar hook-length control protein FliK